MDVNLNFQINLKKFSALLVAEALWENGLIKNEIKTYGVSIFNPDVSSPYNRQNENNWRNIVVKKVVDLLESLHLPNDLFSHVQSMIVFIGETVYSYVPTFIKTAAPFPFDHNKLFPKLYWTQHGGIDEQKMYLMWKKDPIGPSMFLKEPYCDMPGYDCDKLFAYAICCSYADEDVIRESLPKIANLIKKIIGIEIHDLAKFKVNSAMCMVLLWYKTNSNKSLDFNTLYSNLKTKDYPSGADKMFLHCCEIGFKKSAEYFYRKLKGTDKESIVQQAALNCLSETFLHGDMVLSNPTTDTTPEILLYLLKKMTSEQRRIFLADKIAEVYARFLYTWPYTELCTPLLDYFWDKIPKAKRICILIANFTILSFSSEMKHFAFTSTVYQQLTKDLLARASYDLKKFLYPNSKIIFNLFKISDFSSIDVVLEDPDSKSLRWEIIDISEFLQNWMVKGGHTSNVKEYMTHFKMSNNEKKNFLKFAEEPNLLIFLIKSGRFDEAEDAMEWRCGSNQKKLMNVKNKIKEDSVKFCSEFVKSGKLDLIEKYLKWMFKGDDKEFYEMRKKILSVEFIRDQFWFLWINNRKESLKAAQNKCLKFFKYFFKTEEKINSFKKEKLIKDENFVKSIFNSADNIIVTPNFSINFDEIMEFCSVPPDEVRELKQSILDGSQIVSWLDSCGNPKRFLVVNAVVNWVCSNEEQKKNLMTVAFTNIMRISISSVLFTKMCDDDYKEAAKILFAEWLKPYGNIDLIIGSIKQNLLDRDSSFLTDTDVQKSIDMLNFCKTHSARSMLQKIEQGL